MLPCCPSPSRGGFSSLFPRPPRRFNRWGEVKTQILVQVAFDSTHEDAEMCGPYPHGHAFAVEAWGEKDLAGPLDVIVSELHNRTLVKMMNGGSQTGEGVARWILDRLMVTNPEVDGVSVAFGRRKFMVTRERR